MLAFICRLCAKIPVAELEKKAIELVEQKAVEAVHKVADMAEQKVDGLVEIRVTPEPVPALPTTEADVVV